VPGTACAETPAETRRDVCEHRALTMEQAAPAARRLHVPVSVASAALAGIIFLTDLRSPAGYAVPILYIAPLLLSLWQLHTRDTLIAAAGCSGLTIAGLASSGPDGHWAAALANRGFTLVALWATALMVLRFKNAARAAAQVATRLRENEILRERIEAELRERAELARLGQMAAVVAHEVRNPLAAIRGVLEVIRGRLPSDSRDDGVMRDVIARLDALNQFVDDLLVFARPKPPVLKPVAVAPLLQRLVDLLRRDPTFAQIAIEMDGSDLVVPMDAILMERALLNLITNAAQAVKGAGTIRIRADRIDSTCRISVIDPGSGIAPDALGRIFEPFFTTKHRGTGLGLAIAKRVVDQHGGSIALQSAPSAGTTVVVTLPVRDAS
jgi:signal transduction histidine kinase